MFFKREYINGKALGLSYAVCGLMQDSLEPISNGHHDVEGAEEEDKVEVGVAVDGAVLLVVADILTTTRFLLLFITVI